MEPRPRIVIAALSARMLAESARDAGYDVIALDVFGDRDTLAASVEWRRIGAGLHVDPALLCEALSGLAAEGWIAGAGIEPCLAAACAAAPRLPLIGNPPETVAAVRDPATFFAALRELGIAFPKTRIDAAVDGDGWLVKDGSGSGGWHIRAAAPGERVAPPRYAQRVHAGEPVSALFVADGRDAALIGVQRQLVEPLAGRPYVFRGVIGPASIGVAVRERMREIAVALARRFGLVGLGSLDGLLDGKSFVVLELNPRPSASVALYDRGGSMAATHVRACRDRTLALEPARDSQTRGIEIVFAPHDVVVGTRLADDFCHDLPALGARIARNDPVCTVSAAGTSESEVRSLLVRRRQQVLSSLEIES